MAFLNANDYSVRGPYPIDEEEPYLYGFVWTKTRRTNWEIRVTWSINDLGGEVPASTWTVGADTYQRVSGSIDLPHGQPLGTYTAIYRKEGTWTPVIP